MPANEGQIDDLLLWVTLGVMVGERLNYVLFYNAVHLANPGAAAVWRGGMAFHGGALGVILAVIYFARENKIPFIARRYGRHHGSLRAAVRTTGQFHQWRIMGRVTDAPGCCIPGQRPCRAIRASFTRRHWKARFYCWFECFGLAFQSAAKPGLLTGLFLIGYGASRLVIEYVREPDARIGFIFDIVTMGQILSLPMMLAGASFVYWATTHK